MMQYKCLSAHSVVISTRQDANQAGLSRTQLAPALHQPNGAINVGVERVKIQARQTSSHFQYHSISLAHASRRHTMDAEGAHIIQHLRSVIIHSLDTFNLGNAEFASERLIATTPEDPEAAYLYALTLYRQGRYKAAYNRSNAVLSGGVEHLGCAYIFGRLCLNLEKYKEGIFWLVSLSYLYNDSANSENTVGNVHDKDYNEKVAHISFNLPLRKHAYERERSIYPESSAIYHLLGDLYKAQGDTKNSILHFQQAIRYNVFDFEAFQKLANAGADVSVKAVYRRPSQVPAFSSSANGAKFAAQAPDFGNEALQNFFPASETQKFDTEDILGLHNPFLTTPRHKGTMPDVSTPSIGNAVIPDAPVRRTHGQDTSDARPGFVSSFARLGDSKTPTAGVKTLPYPKRRPELSHSHSNRNLKRTSSSSLVPSNADGRPFAIKHIEAADSYLRNLYSTFAKLYRCFQRFDCYKAIRILESLPENERNTPWVLAKLGRLHYEIVNYKQSKRFFVKLRQYDRTRLDDMEYYSTLLWHLQKKVELTYLANELHDIDANLAITWCVMGNLFSLVKESDEAMKCFNKSIAIDPKFTYAHTLKGHEYFGIDNYERALDCFRYSIFLDGRHYNAFYGIGMVYINLGEYQKADYHFRRAVAINPINIILICCVGMVLEKLGKKTLALRQYELAQKLQPLSALPTFKRAQLLFAMQQFPQALEQFEKVKDLAPNEASVHFLLGQLHNIQNEKFLAIREFTIALNLDPKGNYLIREAMEMLKDGET